MSDIISLDLDDLDDDLLQVANEFDLPISKLNSFQNDLALASSDEPMPTLESILNESDDEEDDEILKSLTLPLTTLEKPKKTAQTTTPNTSSSTNNFDTSTDNENLNKSRTNSFSQSGQYQYTNLTEKNGIVCKQAPLKQISSQLLVAIERSDAGLPTAIAIGQLIAVGTSRGLVLLFDSQQILKLYITTEYKDAISALSLNNKCDRLLIGNALGYIFMFDTTNGKCLRQILDVHPYGNAILNLKFTDDSKLACFSDSGGSVFMLEFKRVMGVRGADSTCLFSGSRGEVCHIEPLKFEKFAETIVDKLNVNSVKTTAVKKNLDNISALFNKYSLLAMASFTKVFVVSLRPKLTVLFTFPLTGSVKYLPILNWQFVILQQQTQQTAEPNKTPRRFVTPILACARESSIYFFQVDYYQSEKANNEPQASAPSDSKRSASNKTNIDDLQYQFKFLQLQKSEYKFKIYNFCWLNAKTIAILDQAEKLHIFDIRSNQELQVLSNLPECVQLVFNSCFFKSLATGGYVSKALAYAGESACYQTFQCYLGQLFMLGTKSINLFSLQNWSSRIMDFVNDNRLDLALDLALSMYKGETKALIGLPIDSGLRKEKIIDKIVEILYLYINRAMKQDCPVNGKLELLEKHFKYCSSKCVNVCMAINRQDFLFDNLYNLLSYDRLFEGFFFESLEEHILENKLKQMPPTIIKNFIDYYSANINLQPKLEKCLLHFEISNIDLHNVIQMCRSYYLLDAYIHFFNKAFKDYITPLEEIIIMMQPHLFLVYETAKAHLSNQYVLPSTSSAAAKNNSFQLTNCGNKLLVYLHCCLCGQSYPYYGNIDDDQLSDTVRRTTFDHLIAKRHKFIDNLLENEKKVKSPLAKYLNDLTSPSSNAGNYPIVRMLLNYDISSFLNVISMTFNESSFEAVIGLDKKQQLIDILIEIGLDGSAQNVISTNSIRNNSHLFTFLARQIANKNNNIQVDNSIFTQIIEYLCNREEIDRTEEREQTLLSLLNSFSIKIMEKFDLERLLNLALKAKFYKACEYLYQLKGEYYEIVDCYLSQENSFERQKQIFDIVRGLLDILYESNSTQDNRFPSSSNQTVRTQTFRNRSSTFIEPRDVQLKKLQEKLIKPYALRQMISLSPSETIHLLWIEMNMDLKFLITNIMNFNKIKRDKSPHRLIDNEDDDDFQIKDDKFKNEFKISKKSYDSKSLKSSDSLISNERLDFPDNYDDDSAELLYKFMKGLFDLAEMIKTDRKYMNYLAQFTPDYCELYVDLICFFDPNKVVSLLKTTLSDYSYRVEECLRICRERECWDGSAYLLEKSGQIEAAFSLYLEKMSSLIKDLQKKLEVLTDRELAVLKSSIDAHLMAIVQLCQRNSNSLGDAIKEKIWFSLFDEVMKPIRSLFIHPSIEALLNYGNDSKDTAEETEEDRNNKIIKERLSETKEFFKNLGSYIINSMVGYLNLTTIIDRIVCDPVYGASNFGDIKDLMCKMLEMCSYEQTLLTKCSSLVSVDVYEKMFIYKRISAKSFSSFTNYCHYCSKPLDLASKSATNSIASNMGAIANNSIGLIDPKMNLEAFENRAELNNESKPAAVIYYCGHSFHQSCLEIAQSQENSNCPLCNSSSTSKSIVSPNAKRALRNKNLATKKNHKKQLSSDSLDLNQLSLEDSPTTSSKMHKSSSRQDSVQSKSPVSEVDSNSRTTYNLSLSESQIQALKTIRKRNSALFNINSMNSPNSMHHFNTSLEKQSKLKLAPGNLYKFIE